MHPFFSFTLFNHTFTVAAYSIFLWLAALIVVGGTIWFSRKRELPLRHMTILSGSMLIAALIGARLLHAMINSNLYIQDPSRLWALNTRGFSLFGGIIMAAVTGVILCRVMKLPVWKIGDTVAPFLGLGIASMRVGCFLNGCCFGRETTNPLGVNFPLFSQAHRFELQQGTAKLFSVNPVHPTQLYELTAALVASALATFIIKKKLPDGTAILAFAIFFAAFRWINYYIRITPPTFNASPLFYPLFYASVIILCSILLYKRIKTAPAS
jgi:phosphatidylglycerol:prolipoprotein diacylglycerol transferase